MEFLRRYVRSKWFGALLIITGMIFAMVAFGQAKTQQYRETGITTTARVAGKHSRRTRQITSGGSNYNFNYSLELTFFTETGTEDSNALVQIGDLVLTEIEVAKSYWNSVQEDEQIEVVYLPDNPEEDVIPKARLKEQGIHPGVFFLLAAGCFLAGAIVMGTLQKTPAILQSI